MLQAPEVDLGVMRKYRLQRIREQLRRQDIPLAILVQPVSLRYAIDFREYALFQSHIPMYVLFVPVEGPVVLHGAYNREYELVDEYRPSPYFNPFDGGLDIGEHAERFADSVVALSSATMGISGKGIPVAVECVPADVFGALKSRRLRLHNGEALVERARTIKSPEELVCLRHAIAVAELGMDNMRQALEPGVTENQLWSILHQVNIAHGGDWMEGRMLASGPRTNPWLQGSDRPHCPGW